MRWRPLSARPDETCDAYVAVQQPELLGFVPRPSRRAIWVLWGANQLRHYKRFWRLWLHPPKPILMSQSQVRDYWPVLPGRGDIALIHLPLPDAVRGHPPLAAPPPRRAIFASNPQRNLRALVELWGERILPAAAGRGARRLRRQQPEARRRRLGRLGWRRCCRRTPRRR